IANLCDRVGADVGEVRKGIGTDSRIGSSFLFPGIGYGGSCFPKDVKALLLVGKEAGLTLHVVEAVDRVNEAQRILLVPRIDAHVLATEWNEFREPDFERIRMLMRHPAIFDGRNIYNPRHLRELGFHYEGVGRR